MSSGAVPAGDYKTGSLSSVYFTCHIQPAGCSAAQLPAAAAGAWRDSECGGQ